MKKNSLKNRINIFALNVIYTAVRSIIRSTNQIEQKQNHKFISNLIKSIIFSQKKKERPEI